MKGQNLHLPLEQAGFYARVDAKGRAKEGNTFKFLSDPGLPQVGKEFNPDRVFLGSPEYYKWQIVGEYNSTGFFMRFAISLLEDFEGDFEFDLTDKRVALGGFTEAGLVQTKSGLLEFKKQGDNFEGRFKATVYSGQDYNLKSGFIRYGVIK